MRRTTPSFSSLSATISIKCLLILLIASLSVLIIAPIQVQGITDNTKNSAEVEEEYIQKLSTGEKPSDFVQNKIDSHDVMVFARSYGSHNRQAKDLLKRISKNLNSNSEFLDVDLLPGWDGSLIMTELQEITGQWSFPNIFIGTQHVGGNKELDQSHALGELEDMIINVGQEL